MTAYWDEYVRVAPNIVTIYGQAVVIDSVNHSDGNGLTNYAPRWATAIVAAKLQTLRTASVDAETVRALIRARDDLEARTRFLVLFQTCGDTREDRARIVEEVLLDG